MISTEDARDAENFAREQRRNNSRALTLDKNIEVTTAEADLARTVLADAFTGDKFDKLLGRADVNALFVRGVLRFGGPNG